jgi:predicted transcriptional regulator
MKPVKVGIMPFEQYKKYTIAIARGQIKPKKSDPKIWFDSIETCMQVLSTHNLNLLKLIDEKKPESVEELARISGRQKSNLSRTLKKFERHRIVDLVQIERRKKPVALATQFDILIGRGHEFNHKTIG